jgi:hypothetical protein
MSDHASCYRERKRNMLNYRSLLLARFFANLVTATTSEQKLQIISRIGLEKLKRSK